VLGPSFATPAALHALLDGQIRGHRMARAAVEMGGWALEATRRSLPLAALLASELHVAPRAVVDTGIALGMEERVEALADRAVGAQREGYRRIKLKIAPGRDVECVRAVRAAVGPDANLAVDANCTYSHDDPGHLAALLELDTLGLSMIEQPLAHGDLVRHAELQQRMRTPICLDESIGDAAAVASMLALRSGRMVNVKPGRVGGFTEALAIHRQCSAARTALWCGGMLECGIGRAYNVALASLPGFTEPGDLSPSARYWARDVVSPVWRMDAGRVRVPLDRPGIGVEADEGFIDALTVRASTFTAR
jgi:o-succinylbenzoic acid (OSB) synthetase